MTNILMISAYFWEPPKKYLGIFWQAVHLQRIGYKVVVISSKTHNSDEREVIKGVDVYRVPALYFARIPWAIAFPASLWRFMDHIVDNYKIDIVHVQEISFPCAFFAALYCRIKGLPYVVTAHSSYFGLGWGLVIDLLLDLYVLIFGRLTLRSAEKVAVISRGQVPILLSLGVPKEKIVFTPLGLDTDTSVFRKATKRDKKESRKRLNLTEDDFVIGFVGRLAPDKNVGLLVDAAERLGGKIKNLKLLIVGAGVDEVLLQNKVARYGIENKVLFLGWREDIDKILPAMDVFAFPSLSDGLGRAFLEAMTVGVPVISTKVPGPASVIVNEETGLLVPRNNIDAMVNAILLLYTDERLRKRLSERGTSVRNVFSWKSCISNLENMYKEVLEAHH